VSSGSRSPLPRFVSNARERWQSGGMLECTAIHDELADVRSYTFADPAGACIEFKPGQHLSLQLPLPGGEDFRTFTIASSPTRPDSVRITVKTTGLGGATAWMHRHLRLGMKLRAFGPTGRFNLQDFPSRKLMLISAGVGITPMVSMLQWLRDRHEPIEITFLHYVRTPGHLLFQDELTALDAALPNLHCYQIPSNVPAGESWTGMRGRVSRRQISGLLSPEQTVFCCGPTGFMESVQSILVAEGMSPGNYHQESFGTTANELQELQSPTTPASGHRVAIHFENLQFEAQCGERLLDVLRRNKMVIPTGCQTGLCGTCRLKKIDGSVQMRHQGGLSDLEERQGYILACCSTLDTDLSLVRD